MDEATLSSWDTRPESVRTLANQYADRQSNIADWHPSFFLRLHLLRRMGIELRSVPGYLASFLLYFVLALVPALIITAVVGQWANIPLLSWIIVAAGISVLYNIGFLFAQVAGDNIVSLLRALADEAEIHRLMTWDRRWYRPHESVVLGVAFALGMLVILYVLRPSVGRVPVPAGTLWISGYLSYVLAETWYIYPVMFVEASKMSVCHYELYGLSPIDSLALKRAVRGYTQLGVVVMLVFTSVVLLFVVLLPAGSNLTAPIVILLLLVEYLGVALACVGPRLFIGRIVRAKKEQEMEPLRGELNSLLARLKELTEEEYDQMKRLQDTHDAIRDSSENLLPLGDLAKFAGALALSTLTIVATALADVYVAEWVKPFLP